MKARDGKGIKGPGLANFRKTETGRIIVADEPEQ